MKLGMVFTNEHAQYFRKNCAHLTPPISEAELAKAQFALEEAIRRVEQDVAIETAVRRMEQDLLAADMCEIVREVEDVSHAAPSFISRVKQFIRDRLRLRTHAQ
jgi:hypothetical protein